MFTRALLLALLLPSPQVDSLEQALLAALPLGPQAAAGGVSLPELFRVSVAVLLAPCAQLRALLCCSRLAHSYGCHCAVCKQVPLRRAGSCCRVEHGTSSFQF